jgi:hypothetical protein
VAVECLKNDLIKIYSRLLYVLNLDFQVAHYLRVEDEWYVSAVVSAACQMRCREVGLSYELLAEMVLLRV